MFMAAGELFTSQKGVFGAAEPERMKSTIFLEGSPNRRLFCVKNRRRSEDAGNVCVLRTVLDEGVRR